MQITTQMIDEVADRIKSVVRKTPLEFNKRLSEEYHARIYLKREDLQEVRSFKIRGAYNKMAKLSLDEKKRGVVCASAGNHAQGVAYGCSALKIKGVIFMPVVTPDQKIEKVNNFGGEFVEIRLEGNSFDEAALASQVYCQKEHSVYVHPFNDPLVIAGQGTVAKEIYEELNNRVDVVIAGIGGGGMISGVASYFKAKNPQVTIIGSEPEGAAGMQSSLRAGKVVTLTHVDTFVDGAAVKTVGENTFEICNELLKKVVLVPEGLVATIMVELYQNEGIIVEPAGALAVAALDQVSAEIKNKTVVCIISGGNNDILRYGEILERSLVYQGLRHYFIIEFAQKPGQLRRFLDYCLGPTDDIVRFEYIKKSNKEKGPALVSLELKDKQDLEPLLKRMKEIKLNFRIITSDDLLYHYII